MKNFLTFIIGMFSGAVLSIAFVFCNSKNNGLNHNQEKK